MSRPRSNRVWLKRRKNPRKTDGARSVSFTLQYRDGTGREQFCSLGTKVTEEEAEKRREQLQHELTGPWSTDPTKFCRQFRRRFPAAFEFLCDLHNIEVARKEDDDSLAAFVQSVVIRRWGDCAPYALAEKMLRMAEDARKGWVAEPEILLKQLEQKMPEEYCVLVDYFRSDNNGLLHHVEWRCIFDEPKHVVERLLDIVEKEGWSREKFVEQFKTRYPREYRVVEEHTRHTSLARDIATTKTPLSIVALALVKFARRMKQLEDEDSLEPPPESHPSYVLPGYE